MLFSEKIKHLLCKKQKTKKKQKFHYNNAKKADDKYSIICFFFQFSNSFAMANLEAGNITEIPDTLSFHSYFLFLLLFQKERTLVKTNTA